MKTILLTGGSGYIGSHTLLELAKLKKYKLAIFDNFKNGHIEAIQRVEEFTGEKVEVFKGDLLNSQEIEEAFKSLGEIDTVIHFAALIEAGLSMVNPTRFYENNVVGSLNLFKVMHKYNVKKIVFSSTAAVYGTPKKEEVDESFEIKYENNYGASKYFVEEILRGLAGSHVEESEKINSVILRYFNAAGSNPDLIIGQDYPKPTHAMTLAIEAALGFREEFVILGNDYATKDGTCLRDYIHVQDLAKVHVKALEYLENFKGSDLFCLGTGKGTSVLELVHALEKVHGKFNWRFGERRPGDASAYYANPKKALEKLGWKTELSLEDSVKHAYEWKKKFPKGYE
jgi:UDP-glucose 4-epimerase